MTFGQDFVRVVRERIGPVAHAYEFGAGPGFIGFSLLAHGLCERLTLSDVNPAAVRACEHTVRVNQLDDVAVYQSNVLAGIPPHERWDLVVSNPPHFDGSEQSYRESIRLIDPGFRIHRRFYEDVGKHLVAGGSVLLQENRHASDGWQFAEMIRASGLELVGRLDPEGLADLPAAPPQSARPRSARPSALRQRVRDLVRRVALPIEQALMTPAVERVFKDNRLYQRLASHPTLVPRKFYFLWSRAPVLGGGA